eukprot:23521-Rhodomonas_salina.1
MKQILPSTLHPKLKVRALPQAPNAPDAAIFTASFVCVECCWPVWSGTRVCVAAGSARVGTHRTHI